MSEAFWARFGRAVRLVTGMVLGCAMVSGCATTGTTADGASAYAAPANYRQVIAAEIQTWEDAAAIESGLISAPHTRWMGLAYGGTRPAVCVTLIKPLLFGNIGPAPYMFFFENGKPDYYRQGKTSFASQVGCGDQPMMPFTEVTRGKRGSAAAS